MKRLFLLIALFLSLSAFTQIEPDSSSFVFPMGSKFVLKLVELDSTHYSYTVEQFEEFYEVIDYFETETLFSTNPFPGTIEFIFCVGSSKYGKEEFKSVLLIRNNTQIDLDYSADINIQDTELYESTSVSSLFPDVKNTELWPYPIDFIAIYDIRKYVSKIIIEEE